MPEITDTEFDDASGAPIAEGWPAYISETYDGDRWPPSNEERAILPKGLLAMVDETTDEELDAAAEAYVRQRWPHVKVWREQFPDAWRETRIRIHAALIAAALVRVQAAKVKANNAL